jgi:hypothetical protein
LLHISGTFTAVNLYVSLLCSVKILLV